MSDAPPTQLPRDTLFSALLTAAARFGHNGRWEDMKPGTYSYREVVKMTLALARIGTKVTRPGEHVGVLMPNLVASVALLIGLTAARRIPCMLNYTAGSEGMQNACHAAGVNTILTSRLFLEKAGLVEQAAALTAVRLVYLEDQRRQFGLVDKLWVLAGLVAPRLLLPIGDPDEPAVVLFTSGSEGKPKGVVLSHRALLSNVNQLMGLYPFNPEETILNSLPIFHSFGLTAGTLLPMISGAKLVLYTNPLHFKAIPEQVREKRCTVMFGTSTFLHHYARHATDDDFKTMKIVVAGAEKLADSVRQTWRDRFGIDILEGYGATETAPVLAVNLPGHNRPGTVGKLVAGVEARLIPVPGIERGGELHVRGPNLMSGYYRYDAPQRLEPPNSAAGPGWYNTGDVAEFDADGYLILLGRLKRFAKVAGEMVSLEIVEGLARAASPEALHAASSVAEAARGEAIVLFTSDAGLHRDQLMAVAKSRGIPELAVPRRIRVVEQLPLLGTGKVDYLRLKEMAAE